MPRSLHRLAWVLCSVASLVSCARGPSAQRTTPAPPGLRVDPPDVRIVYSGAEQRVSLRALAAAGDVTSRVTFSAVAPDLVQLQGNTLVIRGGLRYGARTELTARLGGQVVRVPVTIKLQGPPLRSDGSVPADAQSYFAGSAAAPAPAWVYPLPDALLARNMNQIDFQFRGDPGFQLYRIGFDGDTYAQDFYLGKDSCRGDQCRFVPTDEQWAAMTRSASGNELELRVSGSTGRGAAVGSSAPLRIRFSPEDVRGGLYYWSTTIQGIYRVSLESRQATVFMEPKRNTMCVGCHALSQDSTKVAAVFGGPDGIGGVVDGVDGGRYLVRPTNKRWNFQSFSPKGDLLLVNHQQGLRVLDSSNLSLVRQISRDELGGPAAQPEWSQDGESIVFVRYPRDGAGSEVFAQNAGDIAVLPWNGGKLGPVQVIVPSVTGKEYHFYPSWTPDSRWIIFNTGTVPCKSTRPGLCNSYDARNTRLRLVRATPGSAPSELAAATRGPGLSTNWPRVAPFTQREGKLIFFTFSSRGSYGFSERKAPQIWMAAVDLQRAEQQPGADPSYPPFWLPFQKPGENNHLGTWTNRELCASRSECPASFDCVAHQCVPVTPEPAVPPPPPPAAEPVAPPPDLGTPTDAALPRPPADPDSDGDGLVDGDDQCPREPGPKDNQGCPVRRFVTMKTDHLELRAKVNFATNKSRIRPDSFDLLDDVVAILKENPQIKLRIEGHTDNRGKPKKNLKLSDDRARAVRDYLIIKGIDDGRLQAQGFGQNRPIADNKTAIGRDKNRRTDFFIDR